MTAVDDSQDLARRVEESIARFNKAVKQSSCPYDRIEEEQPHAAYLDNDRIHIGADGVVHNSKGISVLDRYFSVTNTYLQGEGDARMLPSLSSST